jgi:O-antigen/teichoic acid export membrane protein
MTNTANLALFGFAFWLLAAHKYSASSVGTFTSVTAGTGLLAAVAALGLQNTMIRHIAEAENPRELVTIAVAGIATVGTALCLLTILVISPHIPASLHLQQHGGTIVLITGLVVFTAVSGLFDAALIAIRASHAVLVTNLIASAVKIVGLLLFTRLHAEGLLLSFGLALFVSAVLAGGAFMRRTGGKRARFGSFLLLKRYLLLTSGNYLATIFGILPSTIVPIEALVLRGPADTARFAIAGLLAGFLMVIPSTVAQVLFAEASRKGVPLDQKLLVRKALRGVYVLLLPAVAITVIAAPLLLSLFGASYAATATGALRVFALGALLAGGTYLVDSLLIARDRVVAYVFINAANAFLILTFVALFLPHSLAAGAGGEVLGQGVSLVIGLVLLTMGGARRRRAASAPAPVRESPRREVGHQPDSPAAEAQIRELLQAWPMMPTTLIAETIGWERPIDALLGLVLEVRTAHRQQDTIPLPAYSPGEVAQCGYWFPPVEIPVGFGQTRSARQLPVLTLITGHSRWLSAVLAHSTCAQDTIEGWWQLLARLGAVPRLLVWDSTAAALGQQQTEQNDPPGEFVKFCQSLGTRVITGTPGDVSSTGIIENAQVNLERSFLPHRSFASPLDFSTQLSKWVDTANTHQRPPSGLSPADLIEADRKAMAPLRSVDPELGWRVFARIGAQPYVSFASNNYSVHPELIGRSVELIANSSKVKVICDGRIAAEHERLWANGQTVTDSAHVTSASPQRPSSREAP